jgi:carbamoyl-phosphate synthase large subunit
MNILLTSAGRRTYLVEYFKDALNSIGKIYASNSEYSPALKAADDYVITPMIYDEDYIPFLLQFVKENDIHVVIPLFDIDLPVLALAKDRFREIGVTVIVSNYNTTQICNDKWNSYKFLEKNGFNTPKTYLSLSKVRFEIQNRGLNYPLIIKPRWGMGSIGIYKADDEQELNVFYNKVKKEIGDSYLRFESKDQIDQSVLIQECIPGQEYGLDIFNDLKGNYIKTFVKKKSAMRSGETDAAITENHQELQEQGEKLAKILKHVGNLDTDWFLFGNKLYVLEMNSRFGGGYPFTHLAGANLIKVLIDLVRFNTYNIKDLNIDFGTIMVKDIKPVKFGVV